MHFEIIIPAKYMMDGFLKKKKKSYQAWLLSFQMSQHPCTPAEDVCYEAKSFQRGLQDPESRYEAINSYEALNS